MATVERIAQGQGHACCPRCTQRARYARDVADMMALRDWAISVLHDPAPEGTYAVVRIAQDRRELAIQFSDDFDLLDAHAQRHAVVHELVHPHLASVWDAVEDGAQEAFGGMAYRVYTGQVRRNVERSVDALATVIAAFLPMPDGG